ncbi:MAG: hypothetical protein HQM06_03050 [Magnetococcales bacterium]|nr:hypothetical protein [Magnetococcales bacterium]
MMLSTKSPFLAGLSDQQEQADNCDFFFGGNQAEGLGAAYLTGNLAISWPSDPLWDSPCLTLTIHALQADGQIHDFKENIPHASQPTHINQDHRPWIEDLKKKSVNTADDLWQNMTAYYPSLHCCDAVREQVKKLPKESLNSIMRGLHCLETYCQHWQTGSFNQNELGCDSTTESEPTKQQYGNQRTFTCPDGSSRLFSYHAKTGKWRIHYDPAPGPGKLYIGYIGRHLRTVRFSS